jgi:hypothetical protein
MKEGEGAKGMQCVTAEAWEETRNQRLALLSAFRNCAKPGSV